MTLIDTPGHAEFAVEVERSLRVLDGAVIVLDGSAGVQAQTLSVWQKAEKYDLPRVYFINKMDKFNANYSKSMQSIENMLKTPGKRRTTAKSIFPLFSGLQLPLSSCHSHRAPMQKLMALLTCSLGNK